MGAGSASIRSAFAPSVPAIRGSLLAAGLALTLSACIKEAAMEPVTVEFVDIECTWFVLFRDPALDARSTPMRFRIGPGDRPAIVVPAGGTSDFRFLRGEDAGAGARMNYRELSIGSWTTSDAVPTPPDAPRITYSILAVSTTPDCDPSADVPYTDMQDLYAKVGAAQQVRKVAR